MTAVIDAQGKLAGVFTDGDLRARWRRTTTFGIRAWPR